MKRRQKSIEGEPGAVANGAAQRRQAIALGGSTVTVGDFEQSVAVFTTMAGFLNNLGTRASAMLLHGPLNPSQKQDLAAVLEAVDIMKHECERQALLIGRASRARGEN